MPRSGTSLVAHIVRLMGVFMGSRFPADHQGNPGGTCEDLEVSRINTRIARGRHESLKGVELTSYGRGQMQEYINRRDSQYPVWGFKCVHTSWVAWQWDRYLSNPRYILVERKPEAVLSSFIHSWNYDPMVAATHCDNWVKAHREFLAEREFLHVDYDDLIKTKHVYSIAEYIGMETDTQAAIEWIRPELNHYQMEAMSQ